jgi:NAD+ diphosphatase
VSADPPAVPPALDDLSATVVVTRLSDGAVRLVERGWPDGLRTGDEPVQTAPGVVAVIVDGDDADAVEAEIGPFADARTTLFDRSDGHRLLGAVAIGQWRVRTRFCPRCGAPLAPGVGGRVLRCEGGHQEFPRLEPAVIMRVVDDADRIVLARSPGWPEGRMSVLAGFVDPGESLEDTVRREVMEEVGVHVGDVTYQLSQPWPFPSSLMMAFEARATSTAIELRDGEIAEAAWFTRESLTAAMAAGEVALPPPLSVAHQLVTTWLARGSAADGRPELTTWEATPSRL